MKKFMKILKLFLTVGLPIITWSSIYFSSVVYIFSKTEVESISNISILVTYTITRLPFLVGFLIIGLSFKHYFIRKYSVILMFATNLLFSIISVLFFGGVWLTSLHYRYDLGYFVRWLIPYQTILYYEPLYFIWGSDVLLHIMFLIFLFLSLKEFGVIKFKSRPTNPPFTKKQLEYINSNYQPKDS